LTFDVNQVLNVSGSQNRPTTSAGRALAENFMSDFLSDEQLEGLDAYWRASNYLAVGQIYLKDNPC
jgi:hypothetical protein